MDPAVVPFAHLYRRAGFGADATTLTAAAGAGWDATVGALVGGLGSPDPGAAGLTPPTLTGPGALAGIGAQTAARKQLEATLARERVTLERWWLARMVAATNPLTEKLTLLLHGQFPTAVQKVRFPSLMLRQNQIFRGPLAAGPFDQLMLAVAQDPAMLLWLDADSDVRAHPNENFARELFERFTMGIGTYTQADVTAAAACFTGWSFDRTTLAFTIHARDHDPTPRTVLGQPGVSTGEEVIAVATRTPASGRWLASRLWSFLAYPVTPADPVVTDLVSALPPPAPVGQLVAAILRHPAFTSPAATGGLVKQPIEWVAGALRALRVPPAGVAAGQPDVTAVLAALGQVPFDPPSVGGWGQNQAWLSTAAALARWEAAVRLAAHPAADLSPVTDQPPGSRVEAAAELLSVSWSPSTATALAGLVGRPPELVATALVAPEYVAN